MIRAASYTRTLLATLGLLTFATSASAECAWVPWIEQTSLIGGTKEREWTTVGASTSLHESEQGLKSTIALQSKPQDGDKIERRATKMIFRTTASGLTFISRWVCLPDTVDPRGPKGSK